MLSKIKIPDKFKDKKLEYVKSVINDRIYKIEYKISILEDEIAFKKYRIMQTKEYHDETIAEYYSRLLKINKEDVLDYLINELETQIEENNKKIKHYKFCLKTIKGGNK